MKISLHVLHLAVWRVAEWCSPPLINHMQYSLPIVDHVPLGY